MSPTPANSTPSRKRFLVITASLLFSIPLLAGLAAARRQSPGQSTEPIKTPPAYAPVRGADRCFFCHQSEVEGYARSAMAHALRPAATREPSGQVFLPAAKITATSDATGYHQRLAGSSESENYKIDYVVGSGNHASGYLIDLNGHLFQSPIAWYRSRNAYDLAPGYENMPNPDFTRPVGEACVFCHSGTALHVPNTLNQFRQPAFAAEAITCERCHGPVGRHLADPRTGTIVNPAKLAPAARDSTCEQCHLFGVARVPNPGKQFSDFLPGETLEQTFSIYHNALPPGSTVGGATFKVISHVEQLALSRCARSSNQQLWCGTCHDPHSKPAEPVAYYREKCLSCHASDFSSRVPAAAHPANDSDCISCHMPRRDAKDGGHTAFTDHRIQRRPEPESELPANAEITAWREPAPDLQKRNIGIAHIDAGVGRRSQSMVIQGFRELTEVQNQFATDPEFFSWMGQALLLGHQSSEAEVAFERAAQLAPTSPVNEGNAASAYAQAGDLDSARTHLERAVAIDPLYLPASGPLVRLYRKQGKTAEADALSARIEALTQPVADSSPTKNSASRSAPPNSKSHGYANVVPAKTAEQAFKNIQVLKGIPSDQLFPAMEFVTSSLGVNCTFCHVEGHFEKDDKKTKQTARAMMRMTLALNKNNFDGRSDVTCYSCHRGVQHPADIPWVANETPSTAPSASTQPAANSSATVPNATPPLPTNLPTVTEIIQRYVSAVGGAAAIGQISTRWATGTITNSTGSTPLDIVSIAPDKQSFIRHLPRGDATTIVNGAAASFAMRGRPANPLQGAELDAARMDADLHFPLHLRELFPELRREYPDAVNGREAWLLTGERDGFPPIKLYFDQETGLLIRQIRYADSVIGSEPTQIDYSDFRAVDNIRLPHRITISEPNSRETIVFTKIYSNYPVDDLRFQPPSSATTPNR
jgi:photosynthetic reaction center cytochrome c subunit